MNVTITGTMMFSSQQQTLKTKVSEIRIEKKYLRDTFALKYWVIVDYRYVAR